MSVYQVEVESVSLDQMYSRRAFYSVEANSDQEAVLIASQMATCAPVDMMPVSALLLSFPVPL